MAREMTNSGVQWIGEIPNNWMTLSPRYWVSQRDAGNWGIDERGDENDAICIRIADFDYTRYCIKKGYEYTLRNYPKYIAKKLCLTKGDILIEKSGGGDKFPVGRTVMYDLEEPALFANFSERIRIKDIYCAKYALYAFIAHYGLGLSRLYFNQTTGLQNLIMSEFMSGVKLPLPPLSEQKVIADFLDAKCGEIDGLLADLEAEVKTLTEYKKSIIAETVTRGLNPNAPMKSSGIPWAEIIPAHWGVEPVYTHFHDKIFLNLDYEYQRAFKFKYGTLEYKNEVGDLAFYMPTYIKYSKVKKGDIIINGLNLNYDFISQRVAITPEDGIITSAYLAIRPLEGVIPSYFCYLFKAMDNMKLFHGMGKGIRLTLSFDELKRVRIPIPNKNEQIEIANYLDSKCAAIDQAITDKTQQIETLKAYKSSLIYEYVTGKKQVAI